MNKKNFVLNKIYFSFFICPFLFLNFLVLGVVPEKENYKVLLENPKESQIESPKKDKDIKKEEIVTYKNTKDNEQKKKTSSEQKKVNNSEDLSKKETQNLLEEQFVKTNIKTKYPSITWKHDLGSIFSKKVRLFYSIPGSHAVPCESFEECFNIKQFIFSLFEHHIPKIDFLFDFFNISGLKEEFIDDKYDKTGLEIVYFFSLLKKDPSLGYFYFKDLDKKYIESVNISFCNCLMSGYSILSLVSEVINFKKEDIHILKKHFQEYLKHLNEIFKNKNIKKKELDVSFEIFFESIIENTNIEDLEKKFLFNLIRTIVSHLFPEHFFIHFKIDCRKPKPIKEMQFKISTEKEHQTIGFVLKIEQKKNNSFYFCFYEIFKNMSRNEENLKLIDEIVILDPDKKEDYFFNHLNINIIQNKKIFFQKIQKINLYGFKKYKFI
ncbi:hypothetical protein LFWB_5180 [Candidatus Phytoplasma luffae]|uniref:Uncharacterized protein n=1 Tax=Loofah witches'-broom phytoplasma TaxID=35773 RepID=A0A975FJC0_LOWBP|nr:hypothetical protein [Candidatus Phytoplasma luffae]QTX03084.1 hypothetical protein LFWB_5180 [Candidatus Phytoplasma luffae]